MLSNRVRRILTIVIYIYRYFPTSRLYSILINNLRYYSMSIACKMDSFDREYNRIFLLTIYTFIVYVHTYIMSLDFIFDYIR